MKHTSSMKTQIGLLLVLPLLAVAAQNRQGPSFSPAPIVPPVSARPVDCDRSACPLNLARSTQPTTLAPADLIFAIEEERVAHDIYAAASARWNLRVFANIAESETRHAAALIQLAATVGVQAPATQPGTYATADLQALYDSLQTLVNDSDTGALRAGALIEETDIADLRRLSVKATDAASQAVLADLERASVNHLAAFVRNLASRGVTYEPKVLAPEDFAALLTSSAGRGGARKGALGNDGSGYRRGR